MSEGADMLPAPEPQYARISAFHQISWPFASCCETRASIPSLSRSAGSLHEARTTALGRHRSASEPHPKTTAPSSFCKLQKSYLSRFHRRHATWCTLLRDGNVATKPAAGSACSAELSGRSNSKKCGRRTTDAEEMGKQRQEERG
jgi:hypothetical protein